MTKAQAKYIAKSASELAQLISREMKPLEGFDDATPEARVWGRLFDARDLAEALEGELSSLINNEILQ